MILYSHLFRRLNKMYLKLIDEVYQFIIFYLMISSSELVFVTIQSEEIKSA